MAQCDLGQLAEATHSLDEVRRILEALVGEKSMVFGVGTGLANTYLEIGNLKRISGDLPAAIQSYERALQIFGGLKEARTFADHYQLARIHAHAATQFAWLRQKRRRRTNPSPAGISPRRLTSCAATQSGYRNFPHMNAIPTSTRSARTLVSSPITRRGISRGSVVPVRYRFEGRELSGAKLGLTGLKSRPPKERFCCAHAGGGAYLSPPCEGGARGGGPQNLRIVSVFAVRP